MTSRTFAKHIPPAAGRGVPPEDLRQKPSSLEYADAFFVNTNNRSQWVPNPSFRVGIDPLPEGVVEIPADHPYLTSYDTYTYYLSWTVGEVPVLTEYTEEQLAQRSADLLHSLRRIWTPIEFIQRFTPEEVDSIYAFAETSRSARIWLDTMLGSTYIDSADERLQTGMVYFAYQGLITGERYSEIMGT
jgi:hypothetical protein